MKYLSMLLLFFICFSSSNCCAVESTFDHDTEGWRLEASGNGRLRHSSLSDPNNLGILVISAFSDTRIDMLMVAPSKFTGDLSMYNGGIISFVTRGFEQPNLAADSFGKITLFSDLHGSASRDLVSGVPLYTDETFSSVLTADMWGVGEDRWDAILSSVDRLTLDISFNSAPSIGVGIIIDDISIVPEPSSALLCFVGMSALCLCRKRPISLDISDGCL